MSSWVNLASAYNVYVLRTLSEAVLSFCWLVVWFDVIWLVRSVPSSGFSTALVHVKLRAPQLWAFVNTVESQRCVTTRNIAWTSLPERGWGTLRTPK